MPSRYRPTYTWQIDWAGNGTYSHPRSDVTEVWISHDLLFGCRPAVAGRGVRVAHATGRLTLANYDNRYDPDSAQAVVNEVDLRRRNACRLLMDGSVVWEGTASPLPRNSVGADSVIPFTLAGKQAEKLTLLNAEVNADPDDVEAVVANFTAAYGVMLDVSTASTREMPMGLVNYRGNGLIFLDNLSRFAGGWCLETNTGEWLLRPFADTTSLTVSATLGLNFEPLAAGYRSLEANGHVRNYANCRSVIWSADSEEVQAGSVTRSVLRGQQIDWTINFEQSRSRRLTGWTRFEGVPDSVGFVYQSNPGALQATGRAQIRGYSQDEPQKFTVRGFGTVINRVEAEPQELTITEFQTQDTFGRQELRLPPWFDSSGDGIAEFTKPFLRNLSQPVEMVELAYSEWQPTSGQSETLRDQVLPGNAVDATVQGNDAVQNHQVMVLAVRHRGGFRREPVRSLIGLTRRTQPPAPLTTSVVATDRTVTLDTMVPSPALEFVYARVRERP